MKKIKLALLCALSLSILSCGSNNKEDLHNPIDPPPASTEPVETPIIKVFVPDIEGVEVVIDDKEKTISFQLEKPQSMKVVKLVFNTATNVKVADKTINYNLSKQGVVNIDNNGTAQSYKLLVKSSSDMANWEEDKSFEDIPDYIKLYKSTGKVQGSEASAFVAVVDLNQSYTFDVFGAVEGTKVPNDFYKEASAKPVILINAGYFNMSTAKSTSLIIREGRTLKNNTTKVTRGTPAKDYMITRSAIGQDKSGDIEINWVYTASTTSPTYAYPTVLANVEGQAPLPTPSATYPANAKVWGLETAVGAGPLLAKDGVLCTQMASEMLGDNGLSNRPRTAIGITSDNKLVLFVCEGDNITPGIAGLTWANTAKEMIKLGCYDVLNMDGGGSTCMLVNGKEPIKNGAGATQRRVATAVGIR